MFSCMRVLCSHIQYVCAHTNLYKCTQPFSMLVGSLRKAPRLKGDWWQNLHLIKQHSIANPSGYRAEKQHNWQIPPLLLKTKQKQQPAFQECGPSLALGESWLYDKDCLQPGVVVEKKPKQCKQIILTCIIVFVSIVWTTAWYFKILGYTEVFTLLLQVAWENLYQSLVIGDYYLS